MRQESVRTLYKNGQGDELARGPTREGIESSKSTFNTSLMAPIGLSPGSTAPPCSTDASPASSAQSASQIDFLALLN